jgi:hypothetical protein
MVHAKRLMQVLKIDQPMLQMLNGEVREVFLAVRGTPANPQIAMTAMPSSISFKIPFSTQTVTVTGGTVKSDSNAVAFSNVKGTLGRGGFTLNGAVRLKPVTVYNLAINATNADIGDTNRLLAALRIDVPLLRTLSGTVHTANLRIAGSGSNPTISMVSTPASVYIPLVNTTHRIHVTSGVVRSDPRGLGFTNVGGTIGSGTFKLNGNVQLAPTQNYNINIVAYNTDLTDTKHLLETLHIAEPMLANLSGTVREARLSIKGSPDSPMIAMVAKPKSIYARVPGTKERVHITGGQIAMDAGTVTFTRTTGEIGGNSFTIDGMASLPPTQVLDLHVTTGRVDLGDAQKLLAALTTGIPMLNTVKLSGTISSADIHIRGNLASPQITLSAVPENIQLETTDKRHNLKISSGGISIKDGRLVVNNLSITSPRSRLVADLIVENLFTKPHLTLLRANIPSFELADLDLFLTSPAMPELVKTVLDAYQISDWHGVISGNVNIEDRAGVYNFAGDVRLANIGGYLAINDKRYRLHDINGRVAGDGPAAGVATIAGGIGRSAFTLNARAAGTAGAMPVWKGLVTARIDPTEYLDAVPIKPAYVLWKLAAGRPIPAEAKFTLSLGSPGSLNVEAGQIAVGEYALRGAGKYEWFGKQSKQEPRISFQFSLSQPIELQRLARIAQLKNIPAIGGSVNAVVKIEGPLSKIHTDGYLALCNVSLPDYEIAGITGKLIPVELKAPSTTTGPFKMTAMLELDSMQVRKLPVSEIRGDLYVARAGSSGPLTLMLQDLKARTADGVITADASVDLSKTFRFDIDLHAKCLDAEQLAEGLFDAGDEITGTVSGQTALCGSGNTPEEFLRNLNGSGRFHLAKGSVKQFGQLEWKLGLASALKRLNLGSLLSSLVPKPSSKFDTMNLAYSINKGTLCLQDFRYCGPGLRLDGNGSLDLICETISMKMAGEIPRSDNPPVFTFAIDAPLKDNDAIASSIKDTLDFQNKDSQQSPYPVLAVPPEAVPLPPNSCPSPRQDDIAEAAADRAQIMNQVSVQPPQLLFNPHSNISRAFSRFREAAHEMAEEIRNTSASQAIPTRMGQVLPPTIVH